MPRLPHLQQPCTDPARRHAVFLGRQQSASICHALAMNEGPSRWKSRLRHSRHDGPSRYPEILNERGADGVTTALILGVLVSYRSRPCLRTAQQTACQCVAQAIRSGTMLAPRPCIMRDPCALAPRVLSPRSMRTRLLRPGRASNPLRDSGEHTDGEAQVRIAPL